MAYLRQSEGPGVPEDPSLAGFSTALAMSEAAYVEAKRRRGLYALSVGANKPTLAHLP
jgi:hypothetical protein